MKKGNVIKTPHALVRKHFSVKEGIRVLARANSSTERTMESLTDPSKVTTNKSVRGKSAKRRGGNKKK